MRKEPRFDGPIPGMSLTTEPGNRPWEQPAQYPTVEEAAEFYIDKLTNPKTNAPIMDAIEEGVPITFFANALQTVGVSRGLHTVHTGVLVSPVIVELLIAMAQDLEIEYTVGTEEGAMIEEEDEYISYRALQKAYPKKDIPQEELESAVNQAKEQALENMGMPSKAQAEGTAGQDRKSGLMSKRPDVDESEMT